MSPGRALFVPRAVSGTVTGDRSTDGADAVPGRELPAEVVIRPAGEDDRLAVRRLVDGALLSVDDLPERLRAGQVLVAARRGSVRGTIVLAPEGFAASRGLDAGDHATPGGPVDRGPSGEDTDHDPHGEGADPRGERADSPQERTDPPGDRSAPPDGWNAETHVRAVAVAPSDRGAGIGTALVRTAARRHGPLVADFEPAVAPFYESLGADVVEGEDGRMWARIQPP